MTPRIVWFRRDLRLTDNPALTRAAEAGPVIPVYLHVPEEDGPWNAGGASRWWLQTSLVALRDSLQRRGLDLVIRQGDSSLSLLRGLARESGADGVTWNRLYEPLTIARDRSVKAALREDGLTAESHNATLLREPWTVTRKDGGSFRAFTPYWRALR